MVGIGAIGGAITALFTEGFKFFKEQKDRQHELKLYELQAARAKEETEKEVSIAIVDNATKMITSSREHDSTLKSNTAWVNDLRASVRPIITYYTVIVATIFFFVGDENIRQQVLTSFILLMEAVTSFWFTGRMLARGVYGQR